LTLAFLRSVPGIEVTDDRPGAPEGNVLWAGDAGDGLFVVHHGVGSERWSADGFTRLA
jgi:hypothetical protein